MLFFDFHKNARSPLARLRASKSSTLTDDAATSMVHQTQPGPEPVRMPDWSSDDHADLLSRDKVKVKDAVKRYLAAKVRNDWVWPPPQQSEAEVEADAEAVAPTNINMTSSNGDGGADLVDEMRDEDGYQADGQPEDEPQQRVAACVDDDNDDDVDSVYSVISEDLTRYKTRTYWESDPNDGDEDAPDTDPQMAARLRRDVRRRELRKEAEWNEGLACFEARRNAWTNAKTVRMRVKPKTNMPASPSRTSRRFSGFFRKSIVGAPQSWNMPQQSPGNTSEAHVPVSADGASGDKASQTTVRSERTSSNSCPVEVIIPVAAPILPAANPLRQSIQQSNYLQVYDKLVVNSLTPSCPINLADMIGACVSGWKRDGEWPPRPAIPIDPTFSPIAASSRKAKRKSFTASDANSAGGRRRSITGFLVRSNNNDEAKTTRGGLRQSFSRALGLTPNNVEASTAEKK